MIIAKKHRYFSIYFWIIVIISMLVLLSIGHTLSRKAFATDGVVTRGEHIITVYDDGAKTGFMTRATTLGEALKQAGIQLAANDVTEPSVDQELVSANYNVTIYRSRPVLVIDGTSRTKIITAYHTGRQIATQAGIKLHDEDITDLEYSTDVVSDGALEKLVIKRAVPLRLVLYGEATTVYTQAKTVGGLLQEKDINLTVTDHVSADDTAPIESGMTLEIWREGKQTVTRKEVVHFPVRQISDANRPIGYKQIKTPGENGKKLVTYEITVKNGKEVKKKAIQTVITKQPVEQIEIVGTKYELPAGSHEDWMRQAGISDGDFGFVNYIVNREGGWVPCKIQGGAIDCLYPGIAMVGYGIVQATPGNKMASAGSDWQTNPVTQLRWANGYAVGRYGSWEAAYLFWIANNHW